MDMKLNKNKCKIIPLCKRLVQKEQEYMAKIEVVKLTKWNGIWINNNLNLEFQLEEI